MARSDLIINLIRSKMTSDETLFRHSVEALIVEESNKQHHVFANQLKELLKSGSRHSGNKSQNRSVDDLGILTSKNPQRKIEDLVLSDDIVNTTEEFIEEQLRSELLRSYGLEPRNRVLLHGPPGVGKTSLAEAIAESLSIPFYVLSYDRLISSFLGETSSRLAEAIEQIKTQRCVLFFDEFETIGKERSDASDVGEIKRIVSSLLLLLESIPSHVILVAATNHPELLDRASWRRFDTKMELGLPTSRDVQKWLKQFEGRTNLKFGKMMKVLTTHFTAKPFSSLEETALNSMRRYIVRKPELSFETSLKIELARQIPKSKRRSRK